MSYNKPNGKECEKYICVYMYTWASLVAQMVKNPPAIWESWVWSLGWENPLEEGTAIHSSILAWRITMDRGAWWVTVHRVTKSQTQMTDFHFMQGEVKLLSRVQLFATPWTVAYQAPPPMEFSRQEYWSGHFLLRRIFPTQGSNPGLPHCRQTL